MTTPCPDKEPMLHALLDGELDAANASALEAHLKTCPGCAQRLESLKTLHDRLAETPREEAPAALRQRVEGMIDAEGRKAARTARRPARPGLLAGWIAAAAMTAVAASLVVTPLALGPSLPQQLADSHVRSLQANHLVDIPTSDRHVVRPWFNGKIDFAPPAPDLVVEGFPLVGGRLDYADGRTIAALVYRRHAHVINLFVLPERGGLQLPRLGPSPGGYAMLHWTDKGLSYWAVSDVEADELKGFREAFVKAAG